MEEIFGKHFSITEPESINTVIYKVNKTERIFKQITKIYNRKTKVF